MLFSNSPAGAENKCVFDGVSKLSDISRPGIRGEDLHCLGCKTQNFFAALNRIMLDKTLNDERNIFHPFRQGRAMEGKYIYTKKEIFPEKPLGNQSLKVFVGCSNDTHID